MAIQKHDPAQAVEREMSNYQRNLVDTCFEEGNYDSAISLLNHLHHPSTKPYPAHIRTVVCIALHPPPSAEDDHLVSRMDSIPSSPSKFTARNQGTSHTLSVSASEAAQRLLKTYARINTPASLLRALPGYGLSDLQGLNSLLPSIFVADDDIDSETSRHSRRIQDAKNCWDVLREDFVRPEVREANASTNGTRSSRRSRRDDTSDREGSPSDVPAPIGRYAWPVLEWLLMTFEKDEAASVTSGQPRYSPLLLSQIPSTRSASSSRWDIEAPLDITFFCLEQPGRFSLGARLLSLLINLTGTVFVDSTMILSAVCTRIMRLTATTIGTLFKLLQSSPTSNRFKVSLCKLCLVGTSSSTTTRKARPKPQARAALRQAPARRTADAVTENPVGVENTASKQEIVSRALPSPSAPEILELLVNPYHSIPADVAGQLRYWLLSAFADLQAQLEPELRDQAWQTMMENGELAKAADGVFANETDPAIVEDLWIITNASGLDR